MKGPFEDEEAVRGDGRCDEDEDDIVGWLLLEVEFEEDRPTMAVVRDDCGVCLADPPVVEAAVSALDGLADEDGVQWSSNIRTVPSAQPVARTS